MSEGAGGRVDLRPELDPTPLVVARYPAGWWPAAADCPFLAAVAEPGETTVVVPAETLAALPAPDAVERGWQRITFPGPLPWELIGFLADIAGRLAEARIPFTSVSGFTTDHVLVRSAQADVAMAVLRGQPAPDLRTDVINP
ncbi:MAG TPA: ACT domain-containing protein [Mycobacteriales bacterium]|nr:ACT domain-containing protein [Mycobacteriales bacterium]